MRKYEVAYLAPNSDGMTTSRLAPATQTFESAFMAFARGTVFSTPSGPVAVEDLHPGDELITADAGTQRLMWKGATTVVPGAPGQNEASGRLTRVATDSRGMGRPSQDLMLGFAARLYQGNGTGFFLPATDVIDGISVIAVTPPSPVRVFHLGLAQHCRLIANGIEVESFHPGLAFSGTHRPEMRALYLSMFPHLRAIEDFGPLRYAREDEERGQSATPHDPLVLY
ncbi:MAG: Hint domain-containing protein [Pseudomonadota bacterium]